MRGGDEETLGDGGGEEEGRGGGEEGRGEAR